MKLDPQTTALLTLDLQQGILGMAAKAESVLPHAGKAVQWARQCGARLIHVGLGFESGHPEIPAGPSPMARARDNNLFVRGTPSAAFHPSVLTQKVFPRQATVATVDNFLVAQK